MLGISTYTRSKKKGQSGTMGEKLTSIDLPYLKFKSG